MNQLLNNIDIADFNSNNATTNLFKLQITGETSNSGTKVVELMVPLKHLSYFSRTLEIALINHEINFILKWSVNCVL